MKKNLLEILVCPDCKNNLELAINKKINHEIKEGTLKCSKCNKKYKIENYIPRFVEVDKYVDSFSFQWTIHSKTQLDSFSGTNESEETFKLKTGFSLNDLKNKLILDAGCGSGRYIEVVNKYGGEVVGVDLSYSVDAAFENIGFKDKVHIVQADIFNLPFSEETFDIIYSIGVLHHTPNTKEAFKQLIKLLKKNGEIAIWVYSDETFYEKIHNRISDFYRIFTTKMPKNLLYYLSHVAIPLYYLKKIPLLKYILMIIIPTSMHPNPTWRVLDTFDWYSPKYQWKHTFEEVETWFKEANLYDITRLKARIAVRGRKI